MRKNDTQPEITFFPQEAPQEGSFFKHKGVHKNVLREKPADPDVLTLLQKLMGLSWKLFVALKYQAYRFWCRYVGLSRKDIPWLKLGVLLLLVYVLFQNELKLSVKTKSPIALLSKYDDENASQNQAQTMAWHTPSTNPYAPASPDMLKDQATLDYIERFSEVARTEMRKYGIPASIKMAQALIESRAGDSRLAQKNNNHFGMKCFSRNCPKGHCSNFFDDHHKDFFRKYESAWESWRSHSQMLVSGRYKPLLKHGNDYKKWADGLKSLGYATDKNYHKKLKAMIEKYELYKLDK